MPQIGSAFTRFADITWIKRDSKTRSQDSNRCTLIISRYWSSSVWFIIMEDVVILNLMNVQDLTYLFYVNSKLNELLFLYNDI